MANPSIKELLIETDDPPVPQRKNVAPKSRVKHILTFLLQGSYVPFLTDKIRNNLRSRAVLFILYVCAAVVVATVVNGFLSGRPRDPTTMAFIVPPTGKCTVGVPLPPFAVHLRRNFVGIAGVTLTATMHPASEVVLRVTTLEGGLSTRAINCPLATTLTAGSHFEEDTALCGSASAIAGNRVVTGAAGLAMFGNLTLTLGGPGSYLLVIRAFDEKLGYLPLTLTSFVSCAADVDNVMIGTKESWENNGYLTIGESYSLCATANWQSGSPPHAATAMLLSLNVQAFTVTSVVIPFGSNDTIDKAAIISNRFTKLTQEDMQNVGGNQWRAEMCFDDVRVMSSNTQQLFVGVYFMGYIVPISSIDRTLPNMEPKQLILPFFPRTTVKGVTGISATFTAGAQDTIAVTARIDPPIAGKTVYAYIRPSMTTESEISPHAIARAGINPKKLLSDTAGTDATGTATISATISQTGVAGSYELVVACDGVLAQWSENTYAYPFVVPPRIVNVSLRFTDVDPVEYVGQYWTAMPILSVPPASESIVAGKIPVLRPQNASLLEVVAEGVPFGEDGNAYLYDIMVPFAVANGTYGFNIFLDGRVVATFNFTILHNMTSGYNQKACAFIQGLRIDTPVYTGSGSTAEVRVVNAFGAPAPLNTMFFVEIPAAYAPPPAGSETTIIPINSTSENTELALSANGISRPLYFLMILYCDEDNPMVKNYISAAMAPRVTSIDVVGRSNTSISVNVSAVWSSVSMANPITLQFTTVWSPTYSVEYTSIPQAFPGVSIAEEGGVVEVPLPPQSLLVAGIFSFVLTSDASALPFLTSTFVSPTVATIVIDTSLFAQTLTVGEALAVQPRLTLLDANNASVEGATVFVELGVEDDEGDIVWTSPFKDHRTLLIGYLATSSSGQVQSATSSPSLADGSATFNGLYIVSAKTNVRLRARYCYATRFILFNGTASETSVCTVDPDGQVLPPSLAAEYIATPNQLSAAPGAELPLVSITGVVGGESVKGLFCAFDAPSTLLRYVKTPIAPYGTFLSIGTTLEISSSIFVVDNAKDDSYTVNVICAGGSVEVKIVVTSTPLALEALSPIPTSLFISNVGLIRVQAFGQNGFPLPEATVQMTVAPMDEYCEFAQCGVLSPSTQLTSVTNGKGIALFTLAFLGGQENFSVSLKFVQSQNAASLRQLVSQQLFRAASSLGLSMGGFATLANSIGLGDTAASLVAVVTGSSGPATKVAAAFAGPELPSIDGNMKVVNPVSTMVCNGAVSVIMPFEDTTAIVPQKFTFKVPPPSVILLDSQGNPVAGREVDLYSNSPAVVLKSQNWPASNNRGEITLSPFTLDVSATGTYEITVMSFGSQGCTINVVVTTRAALTLTQLMQVIAIFVIVFFSPILVATVPYTHVWVSLLAFVLSIGGLGILWGGRSNILDVSSPEWFVILAVCQTAVVVVSAIQIVLLMGQACGKLTNLKLNDEGKSEATFAYAVWLLSVRPETQPPPPPKMVERIIGRCHPKIAAIITKLLPKPPLPGARPALRYTVPSAVHLPPNFIIVLAFAVVLVTLSTLLGVHVIGQLQKWMTTIEAYIPNLSAVPVPPRFEALMEQAMDFASSLLIGVYPQFGGIQTLTSTVRNIDVVTVCDVVRYYLNHIRVTIQNGIIVGICVGWAVAVLSAAKTTHALPSLILSVRRGERAVRVKVVKVESYIALHAAHYALLHQLLMWIVAIIYSLVSISALRQYVVEKAGAVFLASIVSIVVQKFLEVVLVGKFLTDGNYTIVRPELYSVWHYVGLILGVFTAPIKCIARVVTGMVLVVVSMAQLEYVLFPEAFAFMDAVRNGFFSVIALEAHHGNPTALAASSAMVLRHTLRRWWENDASPRERRAAAVRGIFPHVSASVENTARNFIDGWAEGNGKDEKPGGAVVPTDPARDAASQALWELMIILRHPQHKNLLLTSKKNKTCSI